MYSIIRQYLACFLIALLPLQAAAAGRMAVCASMHDAEQAAPTMAEHCARLAGKSNPPADPHPEQKQSGCWIGSICLAGFATAAVPTAELAAAAEPRTAQFPPLIAHYRSIVLDDPQRPPPALR